MKLKVARIAIGDPEAREAIAAALAALECAVGEQWTVRMGALPHGGWELVLQGPERDCSSDAGWQARPLGGGRARHRRVLRGGQKRVEYVESAVRQLLWASIQFPDNPLWSHDPALGRAFEQAVWTVLREQAEGPVHVRFNVWRGAPDHVSYVCKVETAGENGGRSALPWRWWSPLVQTPDELKGQLTEAVRRRQSASRLPA
jgi:hypothetical protein